MPSRTGVGLIENRKIVEYTPSNDREPKRPYWILFTSNEFLLKKSFFYNKKYMCLCVDPIAPRWTENINRIQILCLFSFFVCLKKYLNIYKENRDLYSLFIAWQKANTKWKQKYVLFGVFCSFLLYSSLIRCIEWHILKETQKFSLRTSSDIYTYEVFYWNLELGGLYICHRKR